MGGGQVPVETERTKLMCGHTRRAMPSKPASNYTNQNGQPSGARTRIVWCGYLACEHACAAHVRAGHVVLQLPSHMVGHLHLRAHTAPFDVLDCLPLPCRVR
jgi:hypothetical protein